MNKDETKEATCVFGKTKLFQVPKSWVKDVPVSSIVLHMWLSFTEFAAGTFDLEYFIVYSLFLNLASINIFLKFTIQCSLKCHVWLLILTWMASCREKFLSVKTAILAFKR